MTKRNELFKEALGRLLKESNIRMSNGGMTVEKAAATLAECVDKATLFSYGMKEEKGESK